jgi:hypothetical protein
LPSWKVHRLWSRRLGLSNEISEEVDRIIDLGGEVEGLKVSHDREILWRVIAWVKFTGAKHEMLKASHLPKDEELSWVLSQEWNYYDRFDNPDFKAPNLKEVP